MIVAGHTHITKKQELDMTNTNKTSLSLSVWVCSDLFTILGLWVLGLAVSHINESQLQTYESRTLF